MEQFISNFKNRTLVLCSTKNERIKVISLELSALFVIALGCSVHYLLMHGEARMVFESLDSYMVDESSSLNHLHSGLTVIVLLQSGA